MVNVRMNNREIKVSISSYLGQKKISNFIQSLKVNSNDPRVVAANDFVYGKSSHLVDPKVREYLRARYLGGHND